MRKILLFAFILIAAGSCKKSCYECTKITFYQTYSKSGQGAVYDVSGDQGRDTTVFKSCDGDKTEHSNNEQMISTGHYKRVYTDCNCQPD